VAGFSVVAKLTGSEERGEKNTPVSEEGITHIERPAKL